MRKYLLTVSAMLGLAMGGAQAADLEPAVVFDMGGKFDKSFNEGVFLSKRGRGRCVSTF